MLNLEHRSHDSEIMDDLDCVGEVVDQTLRELEIINRWLGGNQVTLSGIQTLLKICPKQGDIRLADLGCGSGDMLRLISQWGKGKKIPMQLTGIDANPHIIAFASSQSKEFPEIKFETSNILTPEFRKREFDITIATLFTHHFSDPELVEIFKSLSQQNAVGIVINDIHRHWFAYHSIRLLTKMFSKSAMVRFDAPLSVLRAFRRHELETILKKAEIHHYHLSWKWAFRWQLIIPSRVSR